MKHEEAVNALLAGDYHTKEMNFAAKAAVDHTMIDEVVDKINQVSDAELADMALLDVCHVMERWSGLLAERKPEDAMKLLHWTKAIVPRLNETGQEFYLVKAVTTHVGELKSFDGIDKDLLLDVMTGLGDFKKRGEITIGNAISRFLADAHHHLKEEEQAFFYEFMVMYWETVQARNPGLEEQALVQAAVNENPSYLSIKAAMAVEGITDPFLLDIESNAEAAHFLSVIEAEMMNAQFAPDTEDELSAAPKP